MQKQKNANLKNYVPKKYMFNRIISIICILAMLSGSLCGMEALAYTGGTGLPAELTVSNFTAELQAPVGKPEDTKPEQQDPNRLICLREVTEDVLVSGEPEAPVQEPVQNYDNNLKVTTFASKYKSSYTYAELSVLPPEEVVDIIVTLGWRSAVTDSYNYNAGAIDFYSNIDLRTALLNAIAERGAKYTASNRQGVDDLVIIMRAGWYLANPSVSGADNKLAFLLDTVHRNEALPVIKAVMGNPIFKPGIQTNIVNETGKFISNVGACDAELVNLAIPFVQAYIDDIDDIDYWYEYSDEGTRVEHGQGNPTPWGGNSSKTSAFYNVINPIYSVISTAADIIPWKGKVDGFIAKIEELTYYDAQTKVFSVSVENCMWWMQAFGKVHSSDKEALRVLTEAMKKQPYAEVLWFRAATIITGFLKEKNDYYGNPMPDSNQQKQIGMDTLLSEKYVFDDGEIVIYAGDRIKPESIERLYWATKEVSAQYFRGTGSDKPIDGYGNVDDVLTCYIYNDLFEYQANKYIFGLSIDNGGIYIESWGSFYTFDREPGTNLYMLEELFRHEYTHYLQGRYVVPFTSFGVGPVVQNERLDWYQEGGAEWHAGSTRTQGIVPRQSMVKDLKKLPRSNWYDLKTALTNGYNSGWDFYTYGFGLYSYMFSEQMDMYYNITDKIKISRDNATEFDNVIAGYKKDAALNTGYQSHMDMLVANVNNYFIPAVADDYLKDHDVIDIDEIIEEIQGIIPVEDFEMTVYHSEEFNTVKLKGEYKIPSYESQGRSADHKKMDDILDNALTELSKDGWSGYNTFVGYYTDYNVNGQKEVGFNVTFYGILTDDDPVLSNKPPVPKVNGPFNVKEVLGGTEIQFSSEGTTDDGGMDKLSYHWDFGDGNESTEPNPKHIYTDSGRFDVVLTVTDEYGSEGKTNTYVNINGLFIRAEEEDNYGTNTVGFDKANGPIGNNLSVKGELVSGDVDSFYFNVLKTGDVKITLAGEDGNPFKATVYVYGPDSFTEYKGWFGTGVGNFSNLTPGRYYVYFYGSVVGKYTLTVNGPIESLPTDENILPEAKANGPYEGKAGEEISFSSAGSKDEDGTIASYLWSFGDGATSTEANPKHSYTSAGTYTATLTVTDNKGATGTATAQVTVTEDASAGITKETEPNNWHDQANGPIHYDLNVEAELTSTDTSDYFYFNVLEAGQAEVTVTGKDGKNFGTWNVYGPDSTSSIPGYSSKPKFGVTPGRYTIGIWGAVGEYVVNVKGPIEGYVVNNPPVAEANGPYTGEVGQEISFSSAGSKDEDGIIVSYHWTFGDGSANTESNPKHVYEEKGTYTATLTVTDDKGETASDTATVTITKKDEPSTGGITKETQTNKSRDKADGPIYHNLDVNADFIENSTGDWFYFDALEAGKVEVTVTLKSDFILTWGVYKEQETSYTAWPSSTANNIYKGSFDAVADTRYYLTVWRTGGTPGEYTINIKGPIEGFIEEVNNPPTAEANGPYEGEVGQEISFSSTGSTDTDGTIALYLWSFGDGATSTEANPKHAYTGAGTYTATLTVTDDKGATGTATAQVTVTEDASVGITKETEPNNWHDQANGPIHYDLNVEAELTSTDTSDYFYFNVLEAGQIEITVTRKDGNKFGTWNVYNAENTSTPVGYNSKPKFDVTPGRYTIGIWGAVGEYVVNVKGPIEGAPQQSNNPPTAEANGPYEGEAGQEISFSSTGSKDTDGTIVLYLWSFGDGETSTEANPKHAYTEAGTYTATLTVTDDKGATGTDTAQVKVTEKPVIKSVTVRVQIGELTAGTAGEVTFPVDTSNIVSGSAIKLIGGAEHGITLKTTEINDGNTELIIGIDANTENGSYVLYIEVDGVTSNEFTLFVGEKPEYICGIALDKSGTLHFTAVTEGYGVQKNETVVISNTGNIATGDLTIQVQGDADAFVVSETEVRSIAIAGTSSFAVRPASGLLSGTYTATITVNGSDIAAKSFDVSFTVKPDDKQQYTVTYDANGGSGTMPSGTVYKGEDYKIAVNTFTYSGYRFTGWNTKPYGDGISYADGETIADVNSNVTLYAQWRKNSSSKPKPDPKPETKPDTGTEVKDNTETNKPDEENTNNVQSFTDIAGHWAKDSIKYVVERGLFNGISEDMFSPDTSMTRGMFVTVLGRLAGADISMYGQGSFNDVEAGKYYAAYVEWASKNGIVKGISDKQFAPDALITREQMVVMIVNYIRSIGYDLPELNRAGGFADNEEISAWAADAIKLMVQANIINGKQNNLFDPQGNATRAEVSVILYRFLELVEE